MFISQRVGTVGPLLTQDGFGAPRDVRDLGVLDEVRDDAEHRHVLVQGDARAGDTAVMVPSRL